jgi:hypothetical protein
MAARPDDIPGGARQLRGGVSRDIARKRLIIFEF